MVEIKDGRLILTTRIPGERAGFLRTLPDARQGRKDRCKWTCTATPITALRIMVEGFDVNSEVNLLALRGKQFFGDFQACRVPMKLPPLPHQVDAFNSMVERHAGMLAMDMGTMKSAVTIALANSWLADQVLILCPKSVIGVWRREFEKHSPLPYDVVCLDQSTMDRKLTTLEEANGPQCAVVANYESAWREPLFDRLKNRDCDLMVCDESHRIGKHGSKQSKAAYRLGLTAKRRLCLTGTPMGNNPLDLFGQFRFLDSGILGTNYGDFSRKYAVFNEMFPSKVDRWINQEELNGIYQQYSFRVMAGDVLDLPKAMHETRKFELSKEARTLYDQLEEELITEIAAGVITAENALVRLLRLQQITSGHIKDDTDKIHEFESGKEAVLADILTDVNEPVVVACRFRHCLQSVQMVARKLGLHYGEVSGRRRDGLDDMGRMAEVDVCGVQIDSGAEGIDLTRSRLCVLYSIGFRLDKYDQMLARILRPGQERPCVFYRLVAKNTVDHSLYRAIEKKREIISYILEEWQPEK